MTPKEKAIDLVRDMEFEIPYIHDPTELQGDDIAKQCAVIAVKELIRETGSRYWYDVKQEIENL